MAEIEKTQEQEEAKAVHFAFDLGALLPLFQPVLKKAEEFWKPDHPPSTVLLGSLGSAFARAFPSLGTGEQACVLDRIEEGVMVPGDDYLGTAVSTGFLEGLIHRAEEDGTWPAVREALRPLSREYADAYLAAPFHLPPEQPQGA